MLWEQAPTPTADLKFRTANGATIKFTVAICTFSKDGQKWFVLQLLPAFDPVVVPVPAPTPATAIPIPIPAASVITPSVLPVENKVTDTNGILLKQKLDCALQLARTVSLDFNNALTGILGHTSLLLGKAEAGH